MKTISILKLALFFSILYIGTNVLGKGSARNPGETVQHFHVDQNYHRVKKTGFPFAHQLTRPNSLSNAPSPQKFLVRAKRLDIMDVAKEANMARAKRLAKLVHDGTSGRLLIRSKRRDLIQPVTDRQLTRVKRLSFTDHHSNHHGKLESRQSERHYDNHHETKRHHDGKQNLHQKENRNGRKDVHGKKLTHLRKESHDGESHSKMAKHHEMKQMHYGKKESHSKKELHAVSHEKENRREKKESHHLERSKKSSGHKEKKEKKRAIHKVGGGGGGGYYKKKISGGHGVSHTGHENNLRSSRVNHNKWKRNARKYATIANKLSYLKKSKKRNLKQ